MAQATSVERNPFKVVMEQLPQCNQDDITKIKALVDTLAKATGIPSIDPNEEHVYTAFKQQLEVVGLAVSPLPILKQKSKQRFEHACAELKTWSDAQFTFLSKTELNKVYQLAFKLIINMINRSDKLSCNVPTILACAKHVPELFEEAFPGYMQAGLGDVVVAGLMSNAVQHRDQSSRRSFMPTVLRREPGKIDKEHHAA